MLQNPQLKQRPRVRVGIAIYHGDRILLTHHTNDGGLWWVLPGGGVKWGESLRDAAVRECQEEVMLDVTPGRVICVTESIAETAPHHGLHVVLRAAEWRGEPKVGVDPRVHAVEWCKVTDLRGLPLWPPIGEVLAANAYGEAEQAPYISKEAPAWRAFRKLEEKRGVSGG